MASRALREPSDFRHVGTVDGDDVFKRPRPLFGKLFGTVFPKAYLKLAVRLTHNEQLILICLWGEARAGNVVDTSILKIGAILSVEGIRITSNHISTYIKKLERLGALSVIKSSKHELRIELSHEQFWNGGVNAYHHREANCSIQAVDKPEGKKCGQQTNLADVTRERVKQTVTGGLNVIEEVYCGQELVVRYTNPVTSARTAYREMLDYLTNREGCKLPLNSRGKPELYRVDFFIALNLARLGMNEKDVRYALLLGSETAKRQRVNGPAYVVRTVKRAFQKLELD